MFPPMFLVFLVATLSKSGFSVTPLKALKFAQDSGSVIKFTPDFSSYRDKVSVCGWIKEIGTASWPIAFNYGDSDLRLAVGGRYICVFGTCSDWKSKFTISKGTWYHTCITWSYPHRYLKYYVNGELLATIQTRSDRYLEDGETLTLGNYRENQSEHEFGGEMFYLNFYAKELSASEVKRMSDAGMCGDVLMKEHEDTRLVKWEDILNKLRSGTVTDIDISMMCTPQLLTRLELTETKLNDADEKVLESSIKLNKTEKELREITTELNKTRHGLWDSNTELNETKQELFEINTKLEDTRDKLQITSAELNDTEGKCMDTSATLNKTQQDLLYTTTELKETKQELLDTSATLNNTKQELLIVTTKLKGTKVKLQDISVRCNETIEELKEQYNTTNNNWDWSIFLSDQYLNQTLTSDQTQQLQTSWDEVAG